MWIYSKAVVCNGERRVENFRINKMSSVMEAVNGAWEILYEHHEWRPPLSINAKFWRLLDHDIEIPCVVQWGMLWYSALTGSNNDLLNDGVFLERYDKVVWPSKHLSLVPSGEGTRQGLPWYTARQDGGGGPKGK